MSSSSNGSNAWLGVGLTVVLSAATFGVGAFIAGTSVLVGLSAGAFLGAGVGALGLIANKSGNGKGSRRQNEDIVFTTTVRNLPVPILFGRARIAGNYIAIGKFFEVKDAKDQTPGRHLRILNAVIALCEGPIKRVGNVVVNGRPVSRLASAENLPLARYQFKPIYGYADDTIPCIRALPAGTPCAGKPGFIDDSDYGFPAATKVPWRNTAKLLVNSVCGETPALVDVNVDAVGQDMVIRRSATWEETNPGDVAIRAGYDGFTEQYYYCISASTATSAPFGLVLVGRQSGPRQHISPPASVTSSVTKAWYLGRHDIVLMQDPTDHATFHIGYQGIAPDSADWETFRPDPDGYANAIVCDHLDESNGVLHTLHWSAAASQYYVMRWNPLTGRIDRLKVALSTQTVKQFMYSPDFDAYVLVHSSGVMHLLAADTGFIYRTSPTDSSISRARGVFVAGQLIGYVFDSNVSYWDPYEQTITMVVTPGTFDTPVSRDNFTNNEDFPVVQNSWTGHVTITRNNVAFSLINFIPSFREYIDDYSAMGTPKPNNQADVKGDQWADFTPTPLTAQYISRDWSYRQWGNYSLTALEGTSSVAGALWAVMVAEPNLDSARWGGGLDPSYFSLGSFESLHAYCVGPVYRRDTGTDLAVTAIVRTDQTAKATSAGHPLYDGDTVQISGADQAAYNGTFKVFNCTADTFSYTVVGSPATPATTTTSIKATPQAWYAERYKFDFLLDSETNLSSFVASEILTSVNGFRVVIGGKLHVGVTRKGVFPAWHFTEESFSDGSPKLSFVGRGSNPNRVRVMFTNVRDEYRKDYAEANNEMDQNALGRVQSVTLTVNGVARFSHADLLAKAVLDGSQSARRQFEFKTHYLGLVLTAGDAIEVSHQATGLSRVVFRIGMMEEGDDGSITVTAQEQVRARDTIRSDPPKRLQVTGPNEATNPCPCFRVAPLIGDTLGKWFNNGATFQPGTYRIRYVGGAYKDSRTSAYGMDYYSVLTMTDGVSAKIADAPKSGVENTDVGVLIAYALSIVQTKTVTISEPTAIGMIAPPWALRNDGGQGGDTTFELCPPSNCDGENPVPDPIIESDNGGEYYAGGGSSHPDVKLSNAWVSYDGGGTTLPMPSVLAWTDTPGQYYALPDISALDYSASISLDNYLVFEVLPTGVTAYYTGGSNASPAGLWTFQFQIQDGTTHRENGYGGVTWPETVMATVSQIGAVGGVLI